MTSKPRVDFDAIKERADFRAVLAHYGIKLPGRGMQVKICCPFHDDAEPSLSLNLERGLFHCFGAGCGLEGNVLEFVHRMEAQKEAAVSIRAAAITLAGICGIPLDAVRAQKAAREPPGVGADAKAVNTPAPANGSVAASLAETRPSSDEVEGAKRNKPLGFALKLDPTHLYLAERGLPPELVATFGLGFCSKGKAIPNRIAIPIHNAKGELVAYAGRWPGDPPEGEEKYRLPAGFHKNLELFNLHRVAHCRHLVVVEGYFGAIRLYRDHIPAVALMGSSMSAEQVLLLKEYCPRLRAISVMLDGGEAAQRAADVVASQLAREWWVRIVTLPEEAQPDTVPLAELEQLLGRRQPK